MEKLLKIQLTGCSGVGKTTLSKWLSEELRIKFISGSYSDLVPQTKNEKHSDMITKDPKIIYQQDYQVMNLRHKQLAFEDRFITDRSYVDSIAYLINKLSVHIRQCDIEAFIGNCEALLSLECTHLIFIPFSLKFLKNWDIEDNNNNLLTVIVSDSYKKDSPLSPTVIGGILNCATKLENIDYLNLISEEDKWLIYKDGVEELERVLKAEIINTTIDEYDENQKTSFVTVEFKVKNMEK